MLVHHEGRGAPVILIPACLEPYSLLMLMSTLVRPSTTTEFSIGPASQPIRPAASTSVRTSVRALLLVPVTSTSHSTSSSPSKCLWDTFWKAAATSTSSPTICFASCAAEPAGGICTLLSFGGTSGEVTSTSSLPLSACFTLSS